MGRTSYGQKPTGIPWEARGQDAKEPRILCRRKTGQTGEPSLSREELEGAVGVGSLGTQFQFRGMVFLKWEEFSITGCSGRGWVLER